ncbi:MAG TPA: cation diffusion facilitator family transporter [Candidatus Acidoferrum sp.]|nr:cation diffusion facilitator family transporter [Candidatus Acidoferrum sp.]
MSGKADSLKSIFFALAANFAIALAKGVAAFFTNSGSMLAEAIHSLADCGNQLLLLWGVRHAKRSPDEQHPLGYGKSIYFWSFIVALLLFSVGGVFSVYEGVHKLHTHSTLESPLLAIGVLAFAVVTESLSMAGCIREVNKVRAGRSFFQWFRETRQSELLVIFGEDLAALCGLVLALAAVLLTVITGNPLYDALGSIAIGTLLLIVAWMLASEVKALIIGQGVEPAQRDEMWNYLEQQPEIERVFNLLTLQMGDDVMLAVKAQMRPATSDLALIDAINAVEKRLRQRYPQVLWCFFEPDYQD